MAADRRHGIVAWLALLLVAPVAPVAAQSAEQAATSATVAALSPAQAESRGAPLPFTEYEAENAVTNGTVLGPDRTLGSLAAEASGRRAVRLEGRGQFVAFTLARPANAVTVRYAVPDGLDGRGIDATLSVDAGGQSRRLSVTSRYGWFYGRYPFTNRPQDGGAHHFYDHARLRFVRTLPAGTVVRLTVGEGDQAPWYVIDLADFEEVPPPSRPPANALSVLHFGADGSGEADSLPHFRKAVVAARRQAKVLWIPPGRFRLDGHLEVDRVTVAGAGPWHTELIGRGVGIYGRKRHQSRRVVLRDFAIIGEVDERVDKLALSGVGGAMGGNSRISNLWIQHQKVGLWFDGPMDGIVVSGVRVMDTAADGINFHRGVSNATVENSFFRNTGDDGIAAWSGKLADHHITIRNNTVVSPILANGIAIYGGHDISVSGNLVADTVTEGGGIHLGNRFKAVPASGAIQFERNLLVRTGSIDPNWHFGVGALWFYALDAVIAADVSVTETVIRDSTGPAVHMLGKPIGELRLEGLQISGAGGAAFQVQSAGSASMTRVEAEGVTWPAVLICHPGFAIADRGGNRGVAERGAEGCPPPAPER